MSNTARNARGGLWKLWVKELSQFLRPVSTINSHGGRGVLRTARD
jgi:hypothetical protein